MEAPPFFSERFFFYDKPSFGRSSPFFLGQEPGFFCTLPSEKGPLPPPNFSGKYPFFPSPERILQNPYYDGPPWLSCLCPWRRLFFQFLFPCSGDVFFGRGFPSKLDGARTSGRVGPKRQFPVDSALVSAVTFFRNSLHVYRIFSCFPFLAGYFEPTISLFAYRWILGHRNRATHFPLFPDVYVHLLLPVYVL